MRHLAALLVLILTVPALAGPRTEVRGMTVSCPTWGGEWGTDEMVTTMQKLRDLGVNWIAIHPYAGIRADGTVNMSSRAYADPTWITRPIAEAHRLGMKIMIKPHLAYWGSKFSWRGEIEFETDEQWAQFFDTYETWVVTLARISKDADAYVVGTELEATTKHDARWRKIIKAVRGEVGDMPLTYSANWDRVDTVPFWDALDVIGVQSYFPLVSHENLPDTTELDRGWKGVMRQLRDMSIRHGGKKIVLGELGYNCSSEAARQPWSYRSGGPDAEETQRRCLAAAMRALDESDIVVGAFLWKWFPGERSRGNFLKSTPAMQAVIGEFWAPPPGP